MKKQRIRHLFPHHGAIQAETNVPRGWISPQGRFLETKQHWASINAHFRRPDARSFSKEEEPEEAEQAEKNAHLAYQLGWISVGHSGRMNAVAHQRTFATSTHPAVGTLRELLAEVPHLTIQIELQIGEFIPSRGVHEDFDLRDYDLDYLIKRGRLKHTIG
ncbi:MAG: hypothetical protein ACJ763_01760 [Bdellovibrionia bacterium]